jgi:hypothetical protein
MKGVNIVKVKFFWAWGEDGLTNKVNNFINNDKIEVIDIKFAVGSIWGLCVMIEYK